MLGSVQLICWMLSSLDVLDGSRLPSPGTTAASIVTGDQTHRKRFNFDKVCR